MSNQPATQPSGFPDITEQPDLVVEPDLDVDDVDLSDLTDAEEE